MDTPRTHTSLSAAELRASAAVGERVMVRRRLSPAEQRANAGTADETTTLTDIIGTVTAIGDADLTLETRRGEQTVRLADVVVAKLLGPAPTRRGRGTAGR